MTNDNPANYSTNGRAPLLLKFRQWDGAQAYSEDVGAGYIGADVIT